VREVEIGLKDKEPEADTPRLFYFSLVAPLKPAIKVRNQHPDEFECIGAGRLLGVIPALCNSSTALLKWMPCHQHGPAGLTHGSRYQELKPAEPND
jgi:hypothetical protein